MTGFAAAVAEAWQELRIHRLRVLLSLIGVGVAVCALTIAVAVSSIAKQALVEQAEREGGRPATYGIYAYSENGEPPPPTETRRVFAETMRDFGITFHSAIGESEATAVLAKGPRGVTLRAVDVAYADLRRMVPEQGRWLSNEDAQNLSPAIVVDARMLKALGLGPDSLPATVTFSGETAITATIIGQVRKDEQSGRSTAYILFDAYERWFGASQQMYDIQLQMWVPPKGAKALSKAVRAELRSELPGMQIQTERRDYANRDDDSFKTFRYVVGGISALILLLGALSLLNIALVTIKQRVREIGIRRSFGATTSRVFFSVMMESVVATFVAGLVGVVAAVGIVNSPYVADRIVSGVTDVPPFPASAAVLGLAVSLAVGSLAGLLPALIAVRVKIIDAIRF